MRDHLLQLAQRKPATWDNLDEIALDIHQELRKHGGGQFRIELAAGGHLDLEVTPDGGRGKGGELVRVGADGTFAVTVRARWPNGDEMVEMCHPDRFLRILPEFLRRATTPRAVTEL